MIEFESDWWIGVWNYLKHTILIIDYSWMLILFLSHLSSHSVHGNDRCLIRVKVDEPVSSRLPGELVGHHLDAHHPTLTHHVDRILNTFI